MNTVIFNTPDEFLSYIKDLIDVGCLETNRFAEPDTNGLSICDRFRRLSISDAYQFLPLKEASADLDEWPEPELNEEVSDASLYPMLLMYEYYDSFDRFGNVKARYFDWVSLSQVKQSHTNGISYLRATHSLWVETYADEYKEMCKKQMRY